MRDERGIDRSPRPAVVQRTAATAAQRSPAKQAQPSESNVVAAVDISASVESFKEVPDTPATLAWRRQNMMALQRLGGNAAVTTVLRPRTVQRQPATTTPAAPAEVNEKIEAAHKSLDVGDIKAIGNDNLHLAKEEYRWEFISALCNQKWVGIRDEWALEKLWGSFGNEVFTKIKTRGGTAAADWVKSIKGGADLDELTAVRGIPDRFIDDVRHVAYGYLDKNDAYARQELADIGKPMEAPLGPPREPNARIAELQEGAKLLRVAKAAQQALGEIQVGWEQAHDEDSTQPTEAQVNAQNAMPAKFRHEAKPYVPFTSPKTTWDEVDAHWTVLQSVINGLHIKFPALYVVGTHGADTDLATVATGNSTAARDLVAKSLFDLRTHIAATKPRVAGDLAWDLRPIHAQIFGGKVPVKSGLDWHDPTIKVLGEKSMDKHETSDLLRTLGVTTLAAAAFILAEMGTMGAATPFLIAAGLGVSAGMAVQSWEKVYDLAAAKKTSTNPQSELVESGQSDAATIEALMNTALAFVDGFSAAKGAMKAVVGEGAKLLTSATRAGEASLRILEAEVMQAALELKASTQIWERSITELGIERTMELSKKSAFDLYVLVGNKSPVAARLQGYMYMPEALKKITTDELGTRLHMLSVEARKSASDAGNLFQLGVERLGPTKAVKYAGGWDAVIKALGTDAQGVQAVKAWRDRALEQLNDFLYSKITPELLKEQGTSIDKLASEFLAGKLNGTVDELGIGTAKPLIEGLGDKDIAKVIQRVSDRRELAGAGLASAESMRALAKEGLDLKKEWLQMTVTQRGESLLKLANSRLESISVPKMVKFEPVTKGEGFFVWNRWVLQFNEDILKNAEKFEWLLEAVQHESRHAEQVWSVARLKAAEHMPIETMVKPVQEGGLAIPKEIAEAAHNAPKMNPSSAEGRRAEEWFESMMGKGRPGRDEVNAALDSTTDDLHFAKEKLKEVKAQNAPPDDIRYRVDRAKEKWRDYDRAVQNYKALVEEADAYAVQAQFQQEYRSYLEVLHDAEPASVPATPAAKAAK